MPCRPCGEISTDMRGWNAATEIPVSDNGVVQDRWRGLLQEGSALQRGEAAAGDHWLFELTVIKPSSDHPTRMRPSTDLDVPGRHARLRLAGCTVSCVWHSAVVSSRRIAHERSLAHPRLARGNVKTCGDQIPVACEQRHLRADELSAHTISYEQSERARIVEDQCIAPTAGLFPGAEQGLASLDGVVGQTYTCSVTRGT